MSFSSILAPLAIFAGSTIGAFVIAVIVDDVAGLLEAVRHGKFDWKKLPSFMESEFGSQKAAALLGLVIAAATTAVGSVLVHGGLTQTGLQAIADATLAAATAGAAAMLLSVLSDIFDKVRQLTGAPVPDPAPGPLAKPSS